MATIECNICWEGRIAKNGQAFIELDTSVITELAIQKGDIIKHMDVYTSVNGARFYRTFEVAGFGEEFHPDEKPGRGVCGIPGAGRTRIYGRPLRENLEVGQ